MNIKGLTFLRINYEKKLGIPSMDRYINSGVLLINIKQLIQDGLCDKLEEAGHRSDFLHNDQDAINAVCYEGIKLIPLKYNAMRQLLYHNNRYLSKKYGKAEATEAKENPFIIHFIDHQKPWSHKTILMANKWWDIVRMQDEEIINEYISPFIASHKAKTLEILVETGKTMLAHFGVYDLVANSTKAFRKNN